MSLRNSLIKDISIKNRGPLAQLVEHLTFNQMFCQKLLDKPRISPLDLTTTRCGGVSNEKLNLDKLRLFNLKGGRNHEVHPGGGD
jgi:hypothetical protein